MSASRWEDREVVAEVPRRVVRSCAEGRTEVPKCLSTLKRACWWIFWGAMCRRQVRYVSKYSTHRTDVSSRDRRLIMEGSRNKAPEEELSDVQATTKMASRYRTRVS